MKFNVTYAGDVMQGTGALYRFNNGYFSGVAMAVDDNAVSRRVALTGYYETSSRGNNGYQTTDGRYIIMDEGWQKVGTRAIAQYSQSQAQALVNKIIRNNKIIIANNLLCARFANKLSSEQQQSVRELQSRLQVRNNALQAEGLTTDVQTSYPAGYAEMSAYLDALMNGEAIGIATWVVVVIAVTVIAATATAAYYAYKSFADESEKDVKFSQELTRTLTSKLTEEEYQQLLDETKGIVTKSRIKASLGSYGNMFKIAMYVCAGAVIYEFARKIWSKQ